MKDAAVSEAAAVLTALTRDAADQYAIRLSRPPDQFPSLVVVTDASSTGFGFVLFDLRRTVNAKVNGLTRRCVDVTLFKGTWRVLSTRWRTFSVASRRMATVRHGPMGRCPDYSIQVTPAFRVYADAAERTGLTLPFGKTAAATISTAFLYIGAARPQRFATATVASYYHNVIRLARLMLMEPDAATSRLVGSLVTKRIQRWGRPTIDKRSVFSRGDVVRAISLTTVDPAVAAATAACWDAVSRAGSLLTRQSPGSRSDPTPRAQARVLKRRPFLVVELQVFEKMSKSWECLLFDTDPLPHKLALADSVEQLHQLALSRFSIDDPDQLNDIVVSGVGFVEVWPAAHTATDIEVIAQAPTHAEKLAAAARFFGIGPDAGPRTTVVTKAKGGASLTFSAFWPASPAECNALLDQTVAAAERVEGCRKRVCRICDPASPRTNFRRHLEQHMGVSYMCDAIGCGRVFRGSHVNLLQHVDKCRGGKR
ncbi:hypothetical protein FNF28_06192 [Cafeteria roenbergensis]|uniref:Uncharacterized protein n=1 Tax=Cafeteria roenbergensis TaxID=33653 RepID=A0A5A8D0P6_CAFRO|nr:hypothetical protein FNF28_06192 [Cafeteria roenbergensis]